MNAMDSPFAPFIIIGAIALPIYLGQIIYYEIQYRRAKKRTDELLRNKGII